MWSRKIFGHISAFGRRCNFSTEAGNRCKNVKQFPSIPASIYTEQLEFVNSSSYDPILIYKVLGSIREDEALANFKLEKEEFVKMYRNVITIRITDDELLKSQQESGISDLVPHTGEEILLTGSAAALSLSDVVYSQYREAGVLLWRGFKLEQFMNQCYGNHEDFGKGKQMSVHYGSKELNFVTISSPLTTQLPQAVGAAYALKRTATDRCVVVYFGEGAASEGDAHAAFNFAATLDCPVIFIWSEDKELEKLIFFTRKHRNNGYAISTPAREQYRGDGIAARGPAYGINTLRVDGNDIFAMYNATRTAKNWALANQKPVLIEAMTYRIGEHSSSQTYRSADAELMYRSRSEIKEWANMKPIEQFRSYLIELDLWSMEEEEEFISSIKEEVKSALNNAKNKMKPNWKELFNDVYFEMPNHIKKQLKKMENHVAEYETHYPVNIFTKTIQP